MRALQGHPEAVVSSTVTKRNPRPRKYASASERQAAYRARAPEVCFRAEPKTADKLDEIAAELDVSRADLLLSMTKFALTNHDWARFGLTHRPLPYEYGVGEAVAQNPITYSDPQLWEEAKQLAREQLGGHSARAMQLAGKLYREAGGKYRGALTKAQKSLKRWSGQDWTTKSGKPSRVTGERYLPRAVIEGLTAAEYAQTTRAKRKGTAAGQQFVKQPKRIAAKVAALKGNPTMKQPSPAQIAARQRFAEMARSGAFKRKASKAKSNPRKKTVSQKISQLVHEGYPQKQAVAVALSEQRAGKVKRNPAPVIRVGDYVRSYDFPGMHTDHYLEGVVTEVRPHSYVFEVVRRVVGGVEKRIPESLKIAEAPKGKGMFSNEYAVRKIARTNPATGRKGSHTKLNPVKYRDIAKGVTASRVQYAVHMPDRPSYHAMAYFTKKADAVSVAQETSDRIGKPVAVTRVQVHFGPM